MQIQIGRIKTYKKDPFLPESFARLEVYGTCEKNQVKFFLACTSRFSLISMQNTIRTIGVFNVNLLGLLI